MYMMNRELISYLYLLQPLRLGQEDLLADQGR